MQALEGRVAFEPTTAGLRVRDPSDEPVSMAKAKSDDLPEKQEAARGRPLATYGRCDVGCEVERETGIEPV